MSAAKPNRRVLSLWFPRMGAERLLRQARGTVLAPFAVIADEGNRQVLSSVSVAASQAGLSPGQALRDAMAVCPALITQHRNPQAEAAFLAALRRWAGKFSPWVAEEAPDALTVDLTGCAHLFGGEAALLDQVAEDCADLGLSVEAGIADTLGAAWALARFAGRTAGALRSGDEIDQEARATRARAGKRHWVKGGAAPQPRLRSTAPRLAPPGQTRTALAPLPVAALRLPEAAVAELSRLGLRRIDDLIGQPRAGLARRFGRALVQRLDQALGVEPEPIAPTAPETRFATRLTLPEPIGLEADVAEALGRLLPPLSAKLEAKGRGARRVRLQCWRADGSMDFVEAGLARPTWEADRIRPLLAMKLPEIEAGFGIDMLRLEATATEPLSALQHRGHLAASAAAAARMEGNRGLEDLIGRIGARIGLEAITRRHPGDSHIPEKAALTLAAAWSDAAASWPQPAVPRPLMLWPPEPVTAPDTPELPTQFRWRRQDHAVTGAVGPERLSPEWWLDDPAWRSGVRDYWRVTTASGARLWLYFAHGGTMSAGWFCQGEFA